MRTIALILAMTTQLLLLSVEVWAQSQSTKELYDKAVVAMNAGRNEEACDLFGQTAKKSYSDSESKLNRVCLLAKGDRDKEDSYFREGKAAMQNGALTDAARKSFDSARQIEARMMKPVHKAEIDGLYEAEVQAKARDARRVADAETKRVADAETKRVADAEAKRIADAAETKRVADAETKRTADAAENKRIADAETKRTADAAENKRIADAAAEVKRLEQEAYDAALKAFQTKNQSARNLLQHVMDLNGDHKGDAKGMLEQLDVYDRAAAQEQKDFQAGLSAYNQKDYQRASALFDRVAKANLTNRTNAEGYLKKIAIEGAKNDPETAWKQASQAFREKSYSTARSLCEAIVQQQGAKHGNECRTMLADVDRLAPKADPKEILVKLNDGLNSFFAGQYEVAYRSLNAYLESKGVKRDLALFFRGASAAGRYYLSDQKDRQQKDHALQDFKDLKGFSPPDARFVPSKILKLYAEVVPVSR